MRDDKLQEIIELLPYSIRYSGEIEELLDYAREQAERVQELEEDNENLQILSDINRKEHMRIHEQNKRYRALLERVCQVEDLEDVWDIEDDYRALEGKE